MTLADLTYAQQDALAKLGKKHRGQKVEQQGLDDLGRLCVLLPGDQPEPRRRRAITRSGIVERVSGSA